MAKKDYSKLEKDELLKVIEKLESSKKYGLVWEEEKEPEQVVLDCENNLPVFKEVSEKEIKNDSTKPTNILIEGDNYNALTVLNYTHKEKIDVIYIDPPYNTGNKDFIYNDKYIDLEDSFRHSKWLSFMSKRLRLARPLLSNNGVMFISIGEDEFAQLKLLCTEIYGEVNVEVMIWDKISDASLAGSGKMKMTKRFRLDHEYVLVVYKNKENIRFNKPNGDMILKNDYGNHDNDPRGDWISSELCKSEKKSNPIGKNYYEIITPSGRSLKRQWHYDLDTFSKLDNDKRIYWGDGAIIPRLKKFIQEGKNITPSSILNRQGSTTTGNNEINNLGLAFNNPKPLSLIKWIIKISEKENLTILDFFAGSGSTGHAVLSLNEEDSGDRSFILCTNNEENICSDVCYPRIRNVIEGYETPEGNKVERLGGNLKYYKTDLIPVESIHKIKDSQRHELSVKAGQMIAIKENTFKDVEVNEWFQLYENETKSRQTAIYFREDMDQFENLVHKIDKKKTTLYIFSYSRVDKNIFNYLAKNIIVEDIPEPILEIYKEINSTINSK